MDESIKSTIQKLLALASDASDEESHSAMLKARKLMLKYEIDEADITITNSNKIVANEMVYRNKLLWWHKHLAVIIARHFRCNCYRNTLDSYRAEIRFVGLENDVEIAGIIFNFARASIHYHSKTFLLRPQIKRKWKRKHQFKNDYIAGYLAGLNKKYVEQTKSESFELAIVQDALVVQYYDSLSLTNKTIVTPKRAADDMSWRSGYEDGKNFERGRDMIEA